MSYCLAVKVSAGLVFASDSRTHAGVDQVSTYSKMHIFDPGGDRFFVVLSAGNLATTQALVHRLRSDFVRKDQRDSLATVDYMFDAAEYLGRTSRDIQKRYEDINEGNEARFEARFIIGGQIRGQDHQLYLIYPEGNTIQVPDATPFLQIGENKYGKPILDRIIDADTSLEDAARCALISLDSTMRSNVAVGPPVELSIYPAGSFKLAHQLSYEADSPLYAEVHRSWSDTLRGGIDALPRFDWET